MIAFTSNRSGNYQIWVIPVEGGEPIKITTHPLKDGMPCWSPDGTRIAFCSHRSGNLDIWIKRLPAEIIRRMDG
jgi:TolB protein